MKPSELAACREYPFLQQPAAKLVDPRIQQTPSIKLSKEGTDCQITPGYSVKSCLSWLLFGSLSLLCVQQPGAMLETPADKQDGIVPQPMAKLADKSDAPTIGMILCQTKDRIFAEYALRDIHKPIGVADYELTRALPKELASSLPSIEDIETELPETLKEQAK